MLIVCARAFSSIFAAAQLMDLGYREVADVIGGFEAWIQIGLPDEQPPARIEPA